MSALPTPKVIDLDDPLAPRPAPAPTPAAAPAAAPPVAAAKPRAKKRTTPPAAPATATAAGPSLADEPLVAVFARLPESLSDLLADGVHALNAGRRRGRGRVSQQDLLGALVERYVTPEDVAELSALVDDYRRRLQS